MKWLNALKASHKFTLAGLAGASVPILTFIAGQHYGQASAVAGAVVGLIGALGLYNAQPPKSDDSNS